MSLHEVAGIGFPPFALAVTGSSAVFTILLGGKGIVASPISKGPVLLFGLKVLSPEPDQLPGKSNSASDLPPPTATVPPTAQLIVFGSVEFASPLQSRIPTNRADSSA